MSIKPLLQRLRFLIVEADLKLVTLISGIYLLLWAGFAWGDPTYLTQFAYMFPIGTPLWWVLTYAGFGLSMLGISLLKMPRVLLVSYGLTVALFWSWQLSIRLDTSEQHTSMAPMAIMAIVGLLVFHRGGK